MPVRLFKALASLQNYINEILAEKFNIFIIIYWDNILIYTKNIYQNYNLQRYSYFANFKKYCFLKNKVRFLGYVLSAQGVKIEDKKIEVVKNQPKPKLI